MPALASSQVGVGLARVGNIARLYERVGASVWVNLIAGWYWLCPCGQHRVPVRASWRPRAGRLGFCFRLRNTLGQMRVPFANGLARTRKIARLYGRDGAPMRVNLLVTCRQHGRCVQHRAPVRASRRARAGKLNCRLPAALRVRAALRACPLRCLLGQIRVPVFKGLGSTRGMARPYGRVGAPLRVNLRAVCQRLGLYGNICAHRKSTSRLRTALRVHATPRFCLSKFI